MLKKDTIKKIAESMKIPLADLEKALTETAEVDVAIPDDLNIFTKTELDTRDTNQKNEGIKAGKEIGVKEVRKAAGLDEEAGKDPVKVAQAIVDKAVTDAKVAPNEKVTSLTEQIKLLQKTVADKDAEVLSAKEIATSITKDRQILTALPKNRADVFQDDEYLDVVKAKHVKEVDGKLVVVGKDGQPLRDAKTQNILDLNTGLMQVFTERKGWLADASVDKGGRGGDDKNKPTGIFSKKSEVIKHYEDQGKNLNGSDGAEIVNKLSELAKADPAFDMNN